MLFWLLVDSYELCSFKNQIVTGTMLLQQLNEMVGSHILNSLYLLLKIYKIYASLHLIFFKYIWSLYPLILSKKKKDKEITINERILPILSPFSWRKDVCLWFNKIYGRVNHMQWTCSTQAIITLLFVSLYHQALKLMKVALQVIFTL